MEYAADELEAARTLVEGPLREREVRPPAQKLRTFKYVDGIERLSDMKLPFLIDLPNGSSEAIFIVAARNAGFGVVPIME